MALVIGPAVAGMMLDSALLGSPAGPADGAPHSASERPPAPTALPSMRAPPARGAAFTTARSTGVHTRLIASEPADGDTLAESPAEIRLRFSGPVEASLARVAVTDASGATGTLDVESASEDWRRLRAALPDLSPGAYRVSWHVVSADGHPVTGTFVFHVRGAGRSDDQGIAPYREGALPPSWEVGAPSGDDGAGSGASPFAVIARGLAMAALMALAGVLALSAWAEAGNGTRIQRLAGALSVAAPMLVLAHVVLWLGHVAPGSELSLERLAAAMGTQTGGMEGARMACAVLALWGFGLARAPALAAIVAIAAIAISGALGHAVVVEPLWSIPARALHLMAASLWVGGLLVLVAADPTRPDYSALTGRVSALALGAVAVVAVTRAVQALLFLGSLSGVLESAYGRLVLAKIGGLMVLLIFGARHRFVLIPGTAREGPARLRGSVRMEAVAMVLVVLVAGWLAYVPAPAARGM